MKYENKKLDEAIAGLEPGEAIDAVIRWKDEDETENVVIALHADDGESEDDVFFYCETPEGLRELVNPENGEDFVVTSFTNGRVSYGDSGDSGDDSGDDDGCDVSEDTKATLTYGEDGRGTLTISNPDGTVLHSVSLDRDDFRNLESEFTVDGRTYRFNFFDQPGEYGVGCWIYPDGNTDWEIPAEVEIHEGGELVRTNQ